MRPGEWPGGSQGTPEAQRKSQGIQAQPENSQKPQAQPDGEAFGPAPMKPIKVERLWSHSGYTSIIATYSNMTGRPLTEKVAIEIQFFNGENMVDSVTKYIWVLSEGIIEPWEQRTIKHTIFERASRATARIITQL